MTDSASALVPPLVPPLGVCLVIQPGGTEPDMIAAFSAEPSLDGVLWVRPKWQGYWTLQQDLGGTVLGGIGAAVGANDAVTVVYPGAGGTLRWRAQRGDGSWPAEQDFGVAVTGDVTAFTGADGTLHLFYPGQDSTLRWLSQGSGGSWGPEQNLGGQVGGAVTVFVAPGSTLMQLFYRGANGEVQWRVQQVDGTWSGETGLKGTATDRVAAIMLPDTHVLQIFYQRPDRQVETCYRDGSANWTSPKPLGGVLSTNVAVVAIPDSGVVQLFYGGSNGELYSRWRESNGHWSDEQGLGGLVGCDPVAAVVDGQVQVFYRRTGRTLWSRARGADGTWSAEVNAAPVAHVFVLMLENHSFDNIFGRSGIPNLDVAPVGSSNRYQNAQGAGTFVVDNEAPMSMPYGPEHGFGDVLIQLCGEGAVYPPGGPYPPITTSGFVADYVQKIPRQADPSIYGSVMKCFDTPNKLPVIYALGSAFTVCDHWYSSLPSSTWPNRFFVHAASSGGWVSTPSAMEMLSYYAPFGGVTFPNGTVFEAIDRVKLQWRIYNDDDNAYSDDPDTTLIGSLAQVGALKNIDHVTQIHALKNFAADLAGDYPYQYTFIEPNYGDETVTYTDNRGGSSQHPIDDMYGGEALVKAVYEAIRGSSLWSSSLLIITYDEHGGFYDSATPPGDAKAPNDGSENSKHNDVGFTFTQYGARVPAVAISPWISRGVDKTVYDHSSVSATLMALFGTGNLTERDLYAQDLVQLLDEPQPRADTPSTLPTPVSSGEPPRRPTDSESDDDPLPDNEHVRGFLGVALKTRLESCADDEVARQAHIDEARAITTRGQARRFLLDTRAMITAARAARAGGAATAARAGE